MTMNNILTSGCLRIIQTIPKLSSELLPDEKTSQNILKNNCVKTGLSWKSDVPHNKVVIRIVTT